MAKNIYNSNHMQTFRWTNSGSAVLAGAIVAIGALGQATLAVAITDIGSGESGAVGVNCGVTAPKVSGAVFAQGESLNWDASAGEFDDNQATPAVGDVSGPSARADAAGADGDATCRVWLTGVPGTLTPA